MVNEDILKYLPPDMLAAYKKVETLKNYHEIMKRISKGLSCEQTEEEFTKERRAEDQNFNNIKNMEESENMIDYKKKYEDALDNFKKIKAANKDNKELVDFIEYEYPALKESEDERIRKEILYVIRQLDDNTTICGRNYDFQKWIAWLEKQGGHKCDCKYVGCHVKQGEQKPADISPIFRVGDHIRNKKTGDKVLIEQLDIATKAYCYVSYDGAAVNHSDFPFIKQDEWELIGQKVVE